MRTATNLLLVVGLGLVVFGACSDGEPPSAETGGRGGNSGSGGKRTGGTSGNGGASGKGASGGSSGDGAGGDGATGGTGGDGDAGGTGGGGDGGASGGNDPGGGGMGGSPSGSCSKNSDCIEQGLDWPPICLSGNCVDITTDDCPIVMGTEHLQESEPLIFGALMPGLNPANAERSRFYWGVRVAMEEFADYAEGGGIPIGGEVRRPLLILCHAMSGLDHLIDTVGAPGILAFTTPTDLEIAATRTLIEKRQDVFFLHHAGANPDLANLEDGGRVWHMLGGELGLAEIYVPLVERVEEHVNPAASRTRPTRLVMLDNSGDFFFGSRLPPRLNQILRINGAPVGDQLDVSYHVIGTEGFTGYETANRIAELEPDIVVDLGGIDVMPAWIDAAARERNLPVPFYVVIGSIAETYYFSYVVSLDPTLRTRVVGVKTAAAEDASIYNAYLNRARFVAPSSVNMEETENLYDPIYYLYYSAAAAGVSGKLNGTGMGRAMERLISGDRYDIGPQSIDQIIGLLTSDPKSTIAFYTTMGEPVFDAVAGTRITDGSVFCIRDDFSFAVDVLRYNRQTQSLYGTFPCFDF